jgi:hypothetical protein
MFNRALSNEGPWGAAAQREGCAAAPHVLWKLLGMLRLGRGRREVVHTFFHLRTSCLLFAAALGSLFWLRLDSVGGCLLLLLPH